MREIKFRQWFEDEKEMRLLDNFFVGVGQIAFSDTHWADLGAMDKEPSIIMQYTGLKDKNGDNEVYECDIIDTEGNVIGNQYETPALLKDETNLLIQGFGTGAWLTTYSQAVERGCHDA